MRQSPLTTVLLVVLVISVLASVWLCLQYIGDTRRLRTLQGQLQALNNNQQIIAAVANESVEYSKKNPAIDPLLESVGIKTNKTGSATKPPGK